MRVGLILLITLSGCQLVFPLGDGCTDAECLPVLAAESDASELVVDGDDLFWVIGVPGGAVRTCAIDACEPTTIDTTQDAPLGLVVIGSSVVFAAGSDVRVADRTGTDSMRFTAESGGSPIRSLAVTNGFVFWLSLDKLSRCEFPECSSNTSLPPGGTHYDRLVVDPTRQMWATHEDGLFTFADDGFDLDRMLPADHPKALAITSTTAFAIDAAASSILTWPRNAADHTTGTPIRQGTQPIVLGTDGSRLYIGEADGSVIELESDGTATTIATGLVNLRVIAAANDRVFVIADDNIVRLR